MAYLLEALNGPLEGSIFSIGNRAIIGRDADVDIQLVQKGVSRQHAAVLTNDSNQYFLMDLASKNGTFFRSESIGREKLNIGDRFRIGSTDFLFRESSQGGAATISSPAEHVHLASGPAVGETVDAETLTADELARLRALEKKF